MTNILNLIIWRHFADSHIMKYTDLHIFLFQQNSGLNIRHISMSASVGPFGDVVLVQSESYFLKLLKHCSTE